MFHRQISGYSEGSMSNEIPFHELATDQAADVVRECVDMSSSDDELRQRLTERGFNGEGAAIHSTYQGASYMAMVRVSGPRGESIRY